MRDRQVPSLDERGKLRRRERSGAGERNVCAERRQKMRVRAGDARMQYVAEYRDSQTFKASLLLLDSQRVEERLRRMLVRAVARVDDRGPADARELMRRARRRVAYHDEVGRHRFEIARRVEQSLALRHARRG